MKIDIEKIFNNAVSAVIVMIVVGCCVLVYNGATTVQDKVTAASNVLKEQDKYIESIVKALQEEVISLKEKDNELISAIEELKKKNIENNSFPIFDINFDGIGLPPPSEETVTIDNVQQNQVLPYIQNAVPKREDIPKPDFLEEKLLPSRPKL